MSTQNTTTAQRIFLTGSSSGLGELTAKALARRGHHVIATMRGTRGKNEDKAIALQDWAKAEGHRITVIECDVTDQQSVDAAVKAAIEASGHLDMVIHNAGLGAWGVQEGFDSEQALALYDVNVGGPLRVNKAVLPHLRARGRGTLLYISSGLGRVQMPFLGPYTATKHALEAIAGTAHLELRPQGIETVILQPGALNTTFHGNAVQATSDRSLEESAPLKAFYEGFSGHFMQLVQSGQLTSPEVVVDKLIELVDIPAGTRPLRSCVGEDVRANVELINKACAEAQGRIDAALGVA
jgi:NAD(P)-dependent dehydrogenase (short-subunit alcohol dehydrogenase family)